MTTGAGVSSKSSSKNGTTMSCSSGMTPYIVGTHEIWVELNVEIDVDKEREELEKEKVYYDGFIASVRKKLENERFVQNAKPEVVDVERKKLSDATDKLLIIEKRLAQLM